MLEKRRDELAPWLAPFEGRMEHDRVALAMAGMFSSFRSMRQSDEGSVAQVEMALQVLAEFPAWAIEKACLAIRLNGVWRKGAFDQQWPPNDSEIVKEVRDQMRLYADPHRSAVALLEATVEQENVR